MFCNYTTNVLKYFVLKLHYILHIYIHVQCKTTNCTIQNYKTMDHTSIGRYHIFTSGIRYYKLRTVFSIP